MLSRIDDTEIALEIKLACFNFHYQFRFHFPDAQFSQDSAHLEILFKEKQLN